MTMFRKLVWTISDNQNPTAISFFLCFFFLCAHVQVLIDGEQTGRSARRCMLFAHTSSAKRNGFSPLGEIFFRIVHRWASATNSTSAPERSPLFAREARITSPQCQYVSADISSSVRPAAARLFRATFVRVTSHFDTFTPTASHKFCLPPAFALSVSPELDFRSFLPLRIRVLWKSPRENLSVILCYSRYSKLSNEVKRK